MKTTLQIVILFIFVCFSTLNARIITSESDSLELIKLYEATDGANWSFNKNWLTDSPIRYWQGVGTKLIPQGDDTLRVVNMLDMPFNNMTGELPKLELPYLELAYFSINNLSGKIPRFNLDNLIEMDVSQNRYRFEEIIGAKEYYSSIDVFYYSEQDVEVGLDFEYVGNSIILKVDIESNPDYEFEWLANAIRLDVTNSNTFDLAPYSKGATFRCIITHKDLVNVFYKTNNVTISPILIAPEDSAKNVPLDAILSWEEVPIAESYKLRLYSQWDFLVDTTIESTNFQLNSDLVVGNREYSWDVAFINNGETSIPSKKRTFSTVALNEYTLESDSIAVFEFYSSFTTIQHSQGGLWFKANEPLHTWRGIETETEIINDEIIHRVVGIVLQNPSSSNRFIGELSYLNLPRLRYLNLSMNKFEGDIPEVLADNLEVLWLADNNFSGEFTGFKMDKLVYADLSFNELSGEFSISNLKNLEYLLISDNNFSGNISKLNSNSLIGLSASGNEFSGNLSELNCPNIESINVADNKITGFTYNSKFQNLNYLNLSRNEINLNLAEINKLTKLEALYLEGLGLQGEIPQFELEHLKELSLRGNKLSGKVPTLSNYDFNFLDLSMNKFTFASFEDSFWRLKEIIQFIVSPQDTLFPLKAEVNGGEYNLSIETDGFLDKYHWMRYGNKIPAEQNNTFSTINPFGDIRCQITNQDVEGLVLYSESFDMPFNLINPANNATGINPRDVTFEWDSLNLVKRYTLEIARKLPFVFQNKIYIGNFEQNKRIFDADNVTLDFNEQYYWRVLAYDSEDKFFAESPTYSFNTMEVDFVNNENDSLELVKLYNNLDGENWNWNQAIIPNWNDGSPINEWIGIQMKGYLKEDGIAERRVSRIAMDNTNLKGELYKMNFEQLRSLSFQGNKITGEVDVSGMPNLELLYLHNNELTSGVNSVLNHPNILSINLSNNKFNDELTEISNESRLSQVQIDNNEIKGDVSVFNSFENLDILSAENNMLSGNIEDLELSEKTYTVNLSGNEISGDISNFKFTDNMIWVRLNNNNLSGHLDDISAVGLRVLELRENKLTGSLPSKYGSNIETLELSGNELKGDIPDLTKSPLRRLYIKNNKYVFDNFREQLWRFNNLTVLDVQPQDTVIDISIVSDGGNVYLEANITGASLRYQWYKDSLRLSGEKESLILVDDMDAEYYCEITDITMNFLTLYSEAVIPKNASVTTFGSSISAFPNPAADFLKIENESQEIFVKGFTIYSQSGERVLTGNSNSNFFEIDIRALTSGVYHIILETNIGSWEHSFVKSK